MTERDQDFEHRESQLYAEIIAGEEEVQERIEQLANQLVETFQDQDPLFVCLLRGGAPFSADLLRCIVRKDPNFHPELDYMTVSRYGDELVGRTPRIVMDLGPKTIIKDRPVIVVDDMIDRGETYEFTQKHLLNKGASRVYLAALVQRDFPEPRNVQADFIGFHVASEEWLTGCGLDDPRISKEANRWAGYLAIANPKDETTI